MNTPREPVDLTNCDREPIHLSGAIQPHGVLFVLSLPELTIVQLSTNTEAFFGIAPQALLGCSIAAILDESSLEGLRHHLATSESGVLAPLKLTTRERSAVFDAILHRAPEGLIVELEVSDSTTELSFGTFYQQVRVAMSRLMGLSSVTALCQRATAEVRTMTGFDRVMAYRFDDEGNGHVIAESMREGLESYLDLHYPASDIPVQARRLYTLNRLRMIVDVAYKPVPIEPAVNGKTGAMLDLTHSVLRSVSPIHVEYLQNMGVHASMSISLLDEGRLWGLIICHHYSPRFIGYEIRTACDFLSQTLSWHVAASERTDRMEKRASVDDKLRALIKSMSDASDLASGLTLESLNFLTLVDAEGGALVHAGQTTLFGVTPSSKEVEQLVGWLRARGTVAPFATERLATHLLAAQRYAAIAAGLLAVPLEREGGSYLLWFRPVVERTVNWAGDPTKTASLKDGALRLSPRGSFALWKESVRDKSLPWQTWQVETAVDFGHSVASIVLKRAALLEALNRELRATAEELRVASLAKDDFVATISHELRTPLNAMVGWMRLLRSKQLDAQRTEHAFEVIDRNIRIQAKLVEDLLDVSRIISGKMRLDVQVVNLMEVAHAVLDSVRPSADAKHITVHPVLDTQAAVIMGDSARLQQILWNLLANAIKFTPKGGRIHLHLSRTDSLAVISITDTGEGIDPEFLPHVFERFRQAQGGTARIHQGLGLGLAIVRHLVELHGGTVSASSDGRGRGATFIVRLPLSPVRSESTDSTGAASVFSDPLYPPQLRGLRVLLVDDEPDARELLTLELSRSNAIVYTAASAAEALLLVSEIRPEVLVSDIGMPEMDGYELIRAVRQLPADRGGSTPAVALTAYASNQDRARAFLAGFQVHLSKPVDTAELFAALISVSGRNRSS